MKTSLLAIIIIGLFNLQSFAIEDDEFEEVKNESVKTVIVDSSSLKNVQSKPMQQVTENAEALQNHKSESVSKDLIDNKVWVVFLLTLAGSLIFYLKKFRYRFILLLIAVAVLGFYQGGCPDSVGAATQIFINILKNSHWQLAAVLLFIPLLFSLFFGRTFCSSACPLGALQEFAASKEKMFSVSYKTEKLLRRIRLVFFIFLIVLSVVRSTYFFGAFDPFKAIFNLTGNTFQWILAVLLMSLSLFLFRPFCRYFCPLALWMKVLSRFSLFKILNDPDKCVNCRMCQKACPVSVIDSNNQVDNSECIRCGKCIEVCPRNSLVFRKKTKVVI